MSALAQAMLITTLVGEDDVYRILAGEVDTNATGCRSRQRRRWRHVVALRQALSPAALSVRMHRRFHAAVALGLPSALARSLMLATTLIGRLLFLNGCDLSAAISGVRQLALALVVFCFRLLSSPAGRGLADWS